MTKASSGAELTLTLRLEMDNSVKLNFNVLPVAPVRWLVTSARDRGVVETTKVSWSFIADLSFDLFNGTDTVRRVDMSSLEIASTNHANARRYGATKARPFTKLMKRLSLPPDSVLVDLGSGKGKVLLVGAACGLFTKVVGIEFSPELSAVARKNIELFRRKHRLAPIDIVETDATTYRFERDQNVFFLYDPFNEKVLEKVLDNIKVSLAEAPRKTFLIYHSAVHHEVIERSGLFGPCEQIQIRGADFNVYRN
ncbi:MAG: hypothetical protein NVS3B20_21340 [Polyangiales bacterium]